MYCFLNEIYRFESLESTNLFLREHFEEYKTGDVILAREQTAGFGSRKRFWSSKKDKGLYFSILLKHSLDLKEYENLTSIASIALLKTLYSLNLPAERIPPNDILVHKKKISGILTKTFQKDSFNISIVGIGLNLYQTPSDFHLKDTRNTPTSLFLEGVEIEYEKILSLLLSHLDREFYSFILGHNK